MSFNEKEKAERKQRNKDILIRLKRGEALMGDPKDTWFPIRPPIKKDDNALEVFSKGTKKKKDRRLKLVEESQE